MKKITSNLLIISGLAIVLVACSTKKNTFVNRNFHAVTTEYNVLFNGQEAFKKGEEDLFKNYQDDFWNILPIERVQNEELSMMPGQAKNENFVRAETKATKAIQKHSMNIGGIERNPQIDESYLLLGKARYHDGRFLPAIEALNYVLYKYPESSTISEVKIWKEKANIRLQSNETAIDNLKELFETDDKNFKGEILADAHAVLAQAYYNTSAIDSTYAHLLQAKKITKQSEKKARYTFILGQLKNKLNEPDSAYVYFQEVIDMNRKPPRIYMMQAYAEQAKLFNYKNGDTLIFIEKYKKLLADRENRSYLDILNHQVGVFYDTFNLHAKATDFYKAAIKHKKNDNYLALSSYRNLAQLNFDERKFVRSGHYYDSALVLFKGNEKEFFHIQRKRKNLDDVIKYEGIISNSDSLIYVLNLSPNEKENYYAEYIEKIKKRDIEIAIKTKAEAEKLANMQNNNNVPSLNQVGANKFNLENSRSTLNTEFVNLATRNNAEGSNPMSVNTTNSLGQSTFYYYIPASVQQGKLAFERKWGKREHKEDWRWGAQVFGNDLETATDSITNPIIDKNTEDEIIDLSLPIYTTNHYISQLPQEGDAVLKFEKNRNAALYELGFIYNEKFLEHGLAADRHERLLISNPEERYILPAKYNLYKIYSITNSTKAEVVKQEIILQFPNTHYAKVLRGEIVDTANTPEGAYDALYKHYENGEFVNCLSQVNTMLDLYAGNEIMPKFILLKARILARIEGIEAYKNELTDLYKIYPLTEEGIEAKRLLDNDVPTLEKLVLNNEETSSWKMIYDLTTENEKTQLDLVTKINKYIADTHNDRLKLSVDFYQPNKQLLVIHGFLSKETVLAVNSLLQDAKRYKVKQVGIPISTHNYKVIQIRKNLDKFKASIY